MVAKRWGHGNPGSAAPHKIARLVHAGLKAQELEADVILFQALCSLAV